MTYKEAKQAGWKESYTAYSRGYVSRKTDVDLQPVVRTRRGKYYVACPAWNTTQYYLRRYLVKPDEGLTAAE